VREVPGRDAGQAAVFPARGQLVQRDPPLLELLEPLLEALPRLLETCLEAQDQLLAVGKRTFTVRELRQPDVDDVV
jgi:hypothetical protein